MCLSANSTNNNNPCTSRTPPCPPARAAGSGRMRHFSHMHFDTRRNLQNTNCNPTTWASRSTCGWSCKPTNKCDMRWRIWQQPCQWCVCASAWADVSNNSKKWRTAPPPWARMRSFHNKTQQKYGLVAGTSRCKKWIDISRVDTPAPCSCCNRIVLDEYWMNLAMSLCYFYWVFFYFLSFIEFIKPV